MIHHILEACLCFYGNLGSINKRECNKIEMRSLLLHMCNLPTTVVADYFACQKFRGLATKRDTQIFRGGKFSLITSAKKNSARNNLLLTRAIMLMELCIRGYHVYSEATAGEELLCEREPRNTKDSNCYA